MLQSQDRINTIERVSRPDFPSGPVFINVTAHSISATASPQNYSLVVQGQFAGYLGSDFNPDPDSPNAPTCGTAAAVFEECPN